MGKVQRWTEPRCKVLGVPLAKNMDKQGDGTLVVRGFFTSDNRDNVGDIITRNATERAVPRYRQWGNVRYMHMPRPVGKVIRIGADDGLEWNEIEIKVVDPQTVFEVENGLLPALSVGILVNFEDVDFMEDGGWIINDYQLAEISLVDHPANYDARLKDLPVGEGLRTLARQYGFDSLARSMANLLDRELNMEEKNKSVENDAVVTEPVVEPVDKSIETNVAEPAEEVAAEVAEGSPFETKDLAADETSATETVEEVKSEEPEVEETPEPEAEKDLAAIVENLAQTVRSLADVVAGIQETVKALAEAPKAEEQAEGELETEKAIEAAADETPAEPVVETDEQPGEAAERKGATPETVLPGAETMEKAAEAKPVVTDLRQALTRYFTSR